MQEYTLVFNANDMQVLSAALVELPYRVAAPLLQKINAQISAQEQPAGDEHKEED